MKSRSTCTWIATLTIFAIPGCQHRLHPSPATAPTTANTPWMPVDTLPASNRASLGGAYETELAQLIREAADRNPRLAAARNRWMAARFRPVHVSAMPDPMLTYTEMIEPIQTRVGPLERSLQFRQAIPLPGKLQAKGAMATEQARIKELEYHIALRDTVAEVKVSLAELAYLHRAMQIVEQNQKLASTLAEKATGAFASQREEESNENTLTLFDTLKAQSSLAQLAYDKITLHELLVTEESKLNALLSRAPNTKLGAPKAILFRALHATRDELFHLAAERRQEIQAALHKVRSARHAERLARLSAAPDFSLGVQYSFIGDAIGSPQGEGRDAIGIGLGMSLPVWGAKNRAKREEARHLARAAQHEKRAATDDVMARISKVYFRLQNAERLVRLYDGSLIPQAERALHIAEQWHDTGRDTFGRLIEARMVWLNFQLASQRALVDYEQMVARLEQLVGISLAHLRRAEHLK